LDGRATGVLVLTFLLPALSSSARSSSFFFVWAFVTRRARNASGEALQQRQNQNKQTTTLEITALTQPINGFK
jgi:hypothetical protein